MNRIDIRINSNPYLPNYKTATGSGKTTDTFTLPSQQSQSAADDSASLAGDLITMIDEEEVQEFLRTKAQALPEDIGMRGAEAYEYFKNKAAPILYELHEDGSATIKEGLSPEHWLLASKNLANMQWPKPGLGYDYSDIKSKR